MKKKAFAAVFLSLALAVTAIGCSSGQEGGGGSSSSDQFKVGMVTDTGGLNDESFNQISWEGIKRTQAELGADIKALESKRDDDYIPNLSRFAREGRDIIWGVGFKFEKAIPEAAKQFPDVYFGIVDSNLGGNIPENVTAITFKEEEGSFLVGAIAGLKTKTNKVGFIGGITSPLIKKFEAGFTAGVKAVNPNAEIVVAYAESFTDATKGRSLAQNMYNGGVDIIYHASGGVGKGIFDEVKTREQGKYWVIGVDMDQSSLAPDHTLTSMIKRVDNAVFDVSKQLKENTLKKGTELVFGLKEDGVGLAESTSKHVEEEILKQVEELKQKIINGEITVPTTVEEANNFKLN